MWGVFEILKSYQDFTLIGKGEKLAINNCEKKREKTEQIAEDAIEIHHSDKQQTSFQTP